MSQTISALYTGSVMHRRIKPRPHRLKYSLFSLLIDLEEADHIASRMRFFSRNRFNLFSFYDRDFGNRTNEPLRTQIERDLRNAGFDFNGGAIRLFAMPRVLGYAFNPLSVYFCYRSDNALAAIIYEVHNTFGERHSYLIPVAENAKGLIRQECAKRLYVSPFMDMDLTYSFKIAQPGKQISISIVTRDSEGPLMTAVLSAERKELTDTALIRAFFVYPILTLKVIAGIHWEALRIWFKGVGLREHPAPPARRTTIVASSSVSEPTHKDLPVHVLR
jgi:DUF1365 family protein